jgi:hypothetical protein
MTAAPPRAREASRYIEQRPQASAEAIEAPHDERIAGVDVRERAIETRPRSQRARGRILVNDGASGSAQRVELQRCGLLVRRHARIADQARRSRFDDLGVIRTDAASSWGLIRALFRRFPGRRRALWRRQRCGRGHRGSGYDVAAVALDQTIEARVVARRVRGEQLIERNAALFIHGAASEPSARLIDDPSANRTTSPVLDRVFCEVTPHSTARDRRTVRGRIGHEVRVRITDGVFGTRGAFRSKDQKIRP